MQALIHAVRGSERKDKKRCEKMWYWRWRRGLVLRASRFGALELGTWVHEALARWYGPGVKRHGDLAEHFTIVADASYELARRGKAPEHVLEKAEELISLGTAMLEAYQKHYGRDDDVRILAVEIPLEFSFGEGIRHALKPDAVFMGPDDNVWLLETKTAASVRTEHLVIDDQARPYGAMAERALRKLGVMRKGQQFKGILYNFLRKGLPDERQTNAQGKYLNKNGSVSARQPPPLFVRKEIMMSRAAKVRTLQRVQRETIAIAEITAGLRDGSIKASELGKTPHHSCPRTCDFYAMCVAEEEGANTHLMERTMYFRRNPYDYEQETTDERPGFEFG